MHRLIESKYTKRNIITSFPNYTGFLCESLADDVKKKIDRATLWISINQGFYSELISYLNIYGSRSLKPETIVTNGRDLIFHPDFILKQSDEAIRFILMHQVLHCIGDHMNRRENRDTEIWNLACDYAINPTLKGIPKIEPPIDENDKASFEYNEEFIGIRVEDIYDKIKNKYLGREIVSKINTGRIIDIDESIPIPDPDLVVYEYGDEIKTQGDEIGPTGSDDSKDKGGVTGDQPGDQPGGGKEKNRVKKVKNGDRVMTNNGSGLVTKVYDNGDIEINLD